jgi:putative transposase
MESRRYPTDLSDDKWRCISPLFLSPQRTRTSQASPLTGDPRHLLLRSKERLPLATTAEGLRTPWKTVYDWFRRRWHIDGRWERLNTKLRERLRWHLGRETRTPAQASQRRHCGLPVDQDHGSGRQRERGFDPAKKAGGRKRHLCWWTRRGWCLRPRYTAPRCPTRMA